MKKRLKAKNLGGRPPTTLKSPIVRAVRVGDVYAFAAAAVREAKKQRATNSHLRVYIGRPLNVIKVGRIRILVELPAAKGGK